MSAEATEPNKPLVTMQTFSTQLSTVPVTQQRPVAVDLDKKMAQPAVARANSAPSIDHPEGTPNAPQTRSVLQQHVDFFDRNKDGMIDMYETFTGFRALGFNLLISLLAIFVIHPSFSFVTAPGYFDPRLRVHTSNVHKGKHGSDSGVYDTEGRFVPQKFEELFTKWDRDGKGAVSFNELWQMTSDLKCVMDPFGWFAAKFEWFIVYLLCADEQGLVSREKIRGVYDGSLFYQVEAELKEKEQGKQE